ncbi:MAG: AraC family transcriptional regulator [Victivallales bacterium]|jgi:AraC family transcriptional regulator of arabinose operon
MAEQIKYFFQKPPLDSAELSVHGIGIREWMRPCIVDRPSGTGDYLLMFFYQETIIETDEGRRSYPPNTFMIWKRGVGHYYGNKGTRWMHSWVHCDGTLIGRLLKKEGLALNHAIRNVNPVIIEKYLFDLHNELQSEAPDSVIAANIFHSFFRELKRMSAPVPMKKVIPDGILNSRIAMEMNYREKFTLETLAREANISVPHYCAEFRRCFGVPPVEYLIGARMKHAAMLLRDRNRRVGEIALDVGYEDLFYFSRLFKKRFGVSPLEFRRKIIRLR